MCYKQNELITITIYTVYIYLSLRDYLYKVSFISYDLLFSLLESWLQQPDAGIMYMGDIPIYKYVRYTYCLLLDPRSFHSIVYLPETKKEERKIYNCYTNFR